MDPVWVLLATFVVIHALEGALWVRRDAFVIADGWRSWTRRDTRSPLGTQHRLFIFGGPLPPMRAMIVVDPWPLLLSKETAYNLPISTISNSDEVEPFGVTRPQAKEARWESGDVYVAQRLFARTSSSQFASLVVRALHHWSAQGIDKTGPCPYLHEHNEAWCHARLATFKRSIRVLRWLVNALPLVLFLGLAGVFLSHEVFLLWPWVLGAMCLVWLTTAGLFLVEYRKLFPERHGDGWLKFALMLASPLTAARAIAWLSRDLLAGAHPLMVGAILLNDTDFGVIAGQYWRDLQHPLENARFQIGTDERASARDTLRRELHEIIRTRGLETDKLVRPPERTSPKLISYCPRCLEVYTQDNGSCSECPGVLRRPWTLPARADPGSR